MERLIVFVIVVIAYVIYRVMRGLSQPPSTPVWRYTTALRDTALVANGGNSCPFSVFLPDPNLPEARSFHTKVHGVSKRNGDGDSDSRRREIFRPLSTGS